MSRRCTDADRRTIVIMRGTGHNHQEIAEAIGLSRQVVAYQLKRLKLKSLENGVDETLSEVLLSSIYR